MSNARNLSNLLGTGTTIATASIADDAITSAKIADDAVVAAAIADDAVVAAALATDAVTADALSASAIASVDLPAGSILQAITTQAGQSANTISTTSYTAIGLDINITPKQSGSHFLYSAFWLVYDNNSSGTLKVESAMFRGSTNISGNLTHTPYNAIGLANRMPYGGISQLDTGANAVAGTPISYSYKFKKNASGEVSYDVAHNDPKSAFLTIMEIAQ